MRLLAACALAAAALVTGCGGDDEEESAERPPGAQTATQETPATAEEPPAETETQTEEEEPTATTQEPYSNDPNAEEPVRVEAAFTGRAGRITPTRVEVPPYIAVSVSILSADGRRYELRVENHRLVVGRSTRRASVRLDGLQPQERYVATAGGRRLVISATAEPGP